MDGGIRLAKIQDSSGKLSSSMQFHIVLRLSLRHPACAGEGLGNFCGTEADGLKMQLLARHGGVLYPSGGGFPGI